MKFSAIITETVRDLDDERTRVYERKLGKVLCKDVREAKRVAEALQAVMSAGNDENILRVAHPCVAVLCSGYRDRYVDLSLIDLEEAFEAMRE